MGVNNTSGQITLSEVFELRNGSAETQGTVFPRGLVNRVKLPDQNRAQHILSDQSITKVMLNIDSVRKLLDNGETGDSYFRDDQTVISTSFLPDQKLAELQWREELEYVREFAPDLHIPTDYSAYEEGMNDEEQIQAVKDCLEGTKWFDSQLTNHQTSVLVQANGWRREHFELCKSTMGELDTQCCVFYASEYGPRVEQAVKDINRLTAVINPEAVIVVGKQSSRTLKRLPPEVTTVASASWSEKSGIRAGDGHSSRMHVEWKNRVESELANGQSLLNTW